MVKGALIAQRKLVEICCKLDEKFTQRLNFFPLAQFCLKVWPYDWSQDGYQITHPEGRNIPTKSFPGKKEFSIQKSESGQTNWHQFSSLSLAFLLYSVREKPSDLSHNSQIFSSIMLKKKKRGGENQRKVILKSFAFTHANKFYASQ